MTPRRSATTRRMNSGGKNRSSVQSTKRVGTGGHASSGHGAWPGVSDWSRVAAGLLGQGRRDVLVDQVLSGGPLRLLAHDRIKAGVRGPVVGRLSRGRNHPGHQDQHVDGNPGCYQRRGEPAEGLRGHDQATAAADRLEDGIGVLGQPGRVVVAGRSGARVSWPRSRSSCSTRCQYHPTSPAP